MTGAPLRRLPGGSSAARPKAIEFFSGIGLARMGLEAAGFRVTWSNDCEPDKQAMYEGHFGCSSDHSFVLGDIGAVRGETLPRDASLAWASSPCTDLSLAGNRAGLDGAQSGVFWHFARLLGELDESRPAVMVLENVVGLATSHGGTDLRAAVCALNRLGYSVDVLAVDARRFVPQSRPRLFLVGAQSPPEDCQEASELRPAWLDWVFDDQGLRTHRAALPAAPELLASGFGGLVEDLPPEDPRWWDSERIDAFISSMSELQQERVETMRRGDRVVFRTAYRRTRNRVAVWEVRADDIAGCLRTARGGSSKQAVVRLGRGQLQARWMTPREYARLMGADDYDLTGARASQALFGFGDAVAVPVIEWLARNYLMPLAVGKLG